MIPRLHIHTLKWFLISYALSISIEMTVFMSDVLITVQPPKKRMK